MASDSGGVSAPDSTDEALSTHPADGQTLSSNHIFPFFQLPSELRITIYGYLTKRLLIPIKNPHATSDQVQDCAVLDSCPLPNMLLVTKRFATEYQKETGLLKTAELYIELGFVESFFQNSVLKHAGLLSWLRGVSVLHLHLFRFIYQKDGLADFDATDTHALLAAMSSLQHIKVSHIDEIQYLELDLLQNHSIGELTPAYTRDWLFWHAPRSLRKDFNVETQVVLYDKLFRHHTDDSPYTPTPLDRKNRITYIATPSMDEHNYFGVDLEVDEANTFTFEDVEADRALQHSSSPLTRLWQTGYIFHRE